MSSSVSPAEAKRRARRVPEEQRKRGDRSCDLCRKTRYYGNIEDLNDRFLCLEAIVKGAFPNDLTGSIDDLLRLGRRMKFPMPDLSQGTKSVINPDNFLRSTGQTSGQLRRVLTLREQPPNVETAASPGTGSKFTDDDGAQALEVGDQPTDSTKPDEVEHTDTPSQNYGTPGSTSSLMNSFTSSGVNSVEEYWRQLPPQPLMHQLVQLYFEKLHEDFPLFHRGTFEEEYEYYLGELRRRSRLQPDSQQRTVDLELGWLGCLHMILVFASMSNPHVGGGNLDHAGLRRHCVAATRSLLPYFVSKCTLNNLRALLLLALFLHNNNERNATWNLVGTATRIAFALGLHRSDTGAAFKPIEREVRKRVFCTLYVFEQFLATSLGRPTGLGDPDVEVVPPREGLLDGGGGGGDAVFVSFSLRLYRILGRTRTRASRHNGESGEQRSIEETFSDLKEWNSDVSKQQWLVVPFIKTGEALFDEPGAGAMGFDELKTVLGWQNRFRLRASLLLRLQYHYVALLVTRPSLLRELSIRNRGSGANRNTPHSLKEQEIQTTQQTSLSDTCLRHAVQLATSAQGGGISDRKEWHDETLHYIDGRLFRLRLPLCPKPNRANER
ncbi:putative nucleus protein [Eutypa lata UCREL1]|uniref:Putative nucleus protein n=1 Tax=Eutypa lata (strain UCR-EL1) TaxID=1287681 RepID=M7TJ85_EUTLA|nr:putative nucleus protein [Eutypa lata UCREL1]